VDAIKPKFAVIENVEGMLKLHGGKLPELVKAELEKLGYNVEYRVLYAAHYGVPNAEAPHLLGKSNREYQ
jgi:DNA (cytosine-5)-methyltransferase 1